MSSEEEIVSQQELDALLQDSGSDESSSSGRDSGKDGPALARRQLFPLVRTEKLTKEIEEMLILVFDSFCYKASSSLEGLLRAPVRLQFNELHPTSYRDYIQSLPEPSSMWYLRLEQVQMDLGLCMEPILVHSCVAQLMGGQHDPASTRPSVTELEQRVVRSVVERIAAEMESAWARLTRVELRVHQSETRPRLLQVYPPDEALIIADMTMQVGPVEAPLKWGLPRLLLKEVAKQIEGQSSTGGPQDPVKQKQQLITIIQSFPVELEAAVSARTLKVTDLLQLKAGDVLRLDHRIEEPIHVRLNGINKFSASMMVTHDRRAIEIQPRESQPHE